jgi:hypothetical protein
LGVDVRREVANGIESGVRLWHFDIEDDRMLKVIVYLNDVDDGAGPFEALPTPHARLFRQQAQYLWGDHYTCTDVERVVPRASWYQGVGPARSAHIIDPVHVLHRAAPPTRRDRYSVTYSYASKVAYFAFASARKAQRAFLGRWSHLLTDRQRDSLLPPPRNAMRWAAGAFAWMST